MNTPNTRTLLTRGMVSATALAAVLSGSAHPALAAPALTAGPIPRAAAADPDADYPVADIDERITAADVFGLGADAALLGRTGDCNFVIGIWEFLRDNRPASREVRTAAEWAFSESGRACYDFIATEIFTAKRRDDANAIAQAEEKRRSDAARSTAAAAIDVVADAELLSGSDGDFARRIWERVVENPKWPKVKAAARAARDGSPEQQRQFVDAGLAAAAKQDIDDAIILDGQKTEEEKKRLRERAAKQSAAYRVGLAVTEQLLSLPNRDFVTEVWNGTPDGSEVQAAAVRAARSNDPAAWWSFIDTGVHEAKDKDIQLALERLAAEDRRLATDVLNRATAAGNRNLAAAARLALAGSPDAVADFLRVGQHGVPADATNIPGHGIWQWRNAASGKCMGAAAMTDGTRITQTTCGTDDQQWLVMKSGPDGQFRFVNAKDQTRCLSMPADSSADSVDLIIAGCDGGPAQQWQPRQVLTGYRWTNPASNKTIFAQGLGIPENASRVRAGADNGQDTGVWSPDGLQVVVSGNRIGVLTRDGVARVKEGGLSAAWTVVHTGVKQLALSGDRIGVILNDSSALVKEGTLSGRWVPQYTGVRQLVLAGNRIGVLDTEGVARVKEGALTATWTQEHTAVRQLALAGNRIGVLRNDGSALVKEGGLSAAWTPEHTAVRQLVLAGNRIGVLRNDGSALVKEGGLSANWVPEFTGVKQLALTETRVGVLANDGVARVKEGSLSATWVVELTGTRHLSLSGNRIGAVNADSGAQVKEGSLSASWVLQWS